MAKKSLSALRNLFENARNFPAGISHVLVTPTQGGLSYEIQHVDGIETDRTGIFFHIPISGRSEQDAMSRLTAVLEDKSLYPHLFMHENRVYLLKNALKDDRVREFVESVDWISNEHRSAISELHVEQDRPFQHTQINDAFGRQRFSYQIFFHRDFRTIQQQLAAATFPVFSGNDKDPKQIGSAFAVEINGKIRIITAAHVVDYNGRRFQIKTNDFDYISVSGKRSKVGDFGLLEPDDDFVPTEFLELGNSSRCELSDTVYVCGYPARLGLAPTISTGHISKLNAEFQEDTGLLQISSAAVNPNNSGGPVADFRGNVIGILTARALKSEAQNIAFAEPIEKAIAEFNL